MARVFREEKEEASLLLFLVFPHILVDKARVSRRLLFTNGLELQHQNFSAAHEETFDRTPQTAEKDDERFEEILRAEFLALGSLRTRRGRAGREIRGTRSRRAARATADRRNQRLRDASDPRSA